MLHVVTRPKTKLIQAYTLLVLRPDVHTNQEKNREDKAMLNLSLPLRVLSLWENETSKQSWSKQASIQTERRDR